MRTRKFAFEIYWLMVGLPTTAPKLPLGIPIVYLGASFCNINYGPHCSFNLFFNLRIPNLYYLDSILGKNQSSSKRCGWSLSSWKYARNQHCFTGRAQTWKITNHCQGYFWKVPVNLLQSDVENKGQKFWNIKGNSNQEIVFWPPKKHNKNKSLNNLGWSDTSGYSPASCRFAQYCHQRYQRTILYSTRI